MVPERQKVWTDGWTDGRNGRTDGRRQNYIPPTSSGDNNNNSSKKKEKKITVLEQTATETTEVGLITFYPPRFRPKSLNSGFNQVVSFP